MISPIRHFTATTFIVFQEGIFLHWHRKIEKWLPPGGHIDKNEDPVTAALREVKEETGLTCQIISKFKPFSFSSPKQIIPPLVINLEDINDPKEGYHQHIDMIYVDYPVNSLNGLKNGWILVDRKKLNDRVKFSVSDNFSIAPEEDVISLGLYAIDLVANSAN